MSEKNVTAVTGTTGRYVHGNTKYKNSLFCFIFGKEENRAYLLNLYNALNGSSYDNPDELLITTPEDVVYISIKNDISFILDYVLVLYEHQSSYNPNMPLRGLLYMAQLYHSWIRQNFLNGFFKKYKEDVFMNVLTDFDIQLYEKGLREESLREGEIIGEKKGILGTIQILTRMSLPQNTIKTQIMEQYALSEDNAMEYMHQAAAMIKK